MRDAPLGGPQGGLDAIGRRAARGTTSGAAAAGVRSVPAVTLGERVFHGEGALGEAAEAMALEWAR